MNHIKLFENFNEDANKAEFLSAVPKGEKWVYDSFDSHQADTKFPSATCHSDSHMISVQYDDYDSTAWGILLSDLDGEPMVLLDRLNKTEAWETFEKIVGKKNAIAESDYPAKAETNVYWKDSEKLRAAPKFITNTRTSLDYDI